MYKFRRKIPHISNNVSDNSQVSIIIPARDEEHNLAQLLSSIHHKNQYDIIVMNDASSDRTKAVAECYNVRVYDVSNDSTWKGKSHACFEGATFARGSLLLFLDADVMLTDAFSIDRLCEQYKVQQSKGILSVQPYHVIQNWYENISVIFNLMTIVGMNIFSITKGKKGTKSAFGPILLTNKADYKEVQGHLNAKNEIIEGFALSKAYNDANMPVEMFEGEGIANFRMYPQGFKALIEGWSKHFALGSMITKRSTMSLIFIWLMGSVLSTLLILASTQLNAVSIIFSIIVYVIYTFQFYLLIRRTGNFFFIASVFHPILFMFFLAIFTKSWIDINIFKKIIWKEREITFKNKK